MRLEEIRGNKRTDRKRFTVYWNGTEIVAHEGETVLGALIAAGHQTVRHTRFVNEPRSMLCGIGVCFECLVTINGKPNRRACMVMAEPEMDVTSGESARIRETE